MISPLGVRGSAHVINILVALVVRTIGSWTPIGTNSYRESEQISHSII